MIILGIETSCDETAISLVEGKEAALNVLSNIVSSQTKIHSKWGGVVPNLAAREHLKNIVPVLDKALQKAKKSPKDIDLIAVTQGPGLIPALLIGTNAAKALSYIWNKPLLGIHHIEGHIYANFINEIRVSSKFKVQSSKHSPSPSSSPTGRGWGGGKIKFPILCLVVSGGHTQLVLMKKHLEYSIVGQTLDDAAGEAFDKVARILSLGFPGGPAVAAEAAKINKLKVDEARQPLRGTSEQAKKLVLPRPMMNKNNFNFSFSGLKTAVLYENKKHQGSTLKTKKVEPWKNYFADMCYEFQQAVIDVLISKTIKAAGKYKPKTIMLAGGVSANKELRKQLGHTINKELKNILYIIPNTSYCIDNAAMIAAAGFYRWKFMNTTKKKKAINNWKIIQANANLKLK